MTPDNSNGAHLQGLEQGPADSLVLSQAVDLGEKIITSVSCFTSTAENIGSNIGELERKAGLSPNLAAGEEGRISPSGSGDYVPMYVGSGATVTS